MGPLVSLEDEASHITMTQEITRCNTDPVSDIFRGDQQNLFFSYCFMYKITNSKRPTKMGIKKLLCLCFAVWIDLPAKTTLELNAF